MLLHWDFSGLYLNTCGLFSGCVRLLCRDPQQIYKKYNFSSCTLLSLCGGLGKQFGLEEIVKCSHTDISSPTVKKGALHYWQSFIQSLEQTLMSASAAQSVPLCPAGLSFHCHFQRRWTPTFSSQSPQAISDCDPNRIVMQMLVSDRFHKVKGDEKSENRWCWGQLFFKTG